MKVILQQAVKGLGEAGDVVIVADGYGRNYLIPRGLALQATKANLKEAEERARRRAADAAKALAAAREQAARLEGARVTVRAKAGEGGRLFGSVTNQDIAAAIEAAFGVGVDKRRVELEEPLKQLGAHKVTVKLHPEVAVTVTVDVVAEAE